LRRSPGRAGDAISVELLPLDLGPQRHLIAFDRDPDIVLVDAGHFGVDDVGLVLLGYVLPDARRPGLSFETGRLKEAAEQCVEFSIAERVILKSDWPWFPLLLNPRHWDRRLLRFARADGSCTGNLYAAQRQFRDRTTDPL
jgi:hypothetical protein